MKHIWNKFKESWRVDIRFLYVFLLDLLFYAIFVPCFLLYVFFINKKAEILGNILGTQDVASYMTAASEFELSLMTIDMKSFVLTFIIGAIIVFLIGLFAYSLSRILLWNLLAKKKFNFVKYLKFNLLNLMLLISLLIVGLIYSLLMFISRLVFAILFLFLALAVIYFIFILYLEFVKTGRIFHSIGNTFKKMDKRVYLLSLPVFLIISFILTVIGLFISQNLYSIIAAAVYILFAVWMRFFVFETQKEGIFD